MAIPEPIFCSELGRVIKSNDECVHELEKCPKCGNIIPHCMVIHCEVHGISCKWCADKEHEKEDMTGLGDY